MSGARKDDISRLTEGIILVNTLREAVSNVEEASKFTLSFILGEVEPNYETPDDTG